MRAAPMFLLLQPSAAEDWQSASAGIATPVLWLRNNNPYGSVATNYGSAGATLNSTLSLVDLRQTGCNGLLDEAFKWTSASAQMTIPSDASWSSATAYTWVFLVNLTGLGTANNGHLMFESNSWRIMLNSDSTVTANMNGSTSTTIDTITLNSFMMITVTMNTGGADKKARIYFNGAECTYSVQNEGTGTPIAGTIHFGNNTGLARAIVGKVDEILYYSTALTLAQIQRLNAAKGISSIIPTVRLTQPGDTEIIQRSGTSGTINIAGTAQVGGSVVARWGGGSWATIATGVSAGASFTGQLTSQAQGQHDLEVAMLGSEASAVTVPNVGIGDVYLIMGQSNASGQGTNNQTYAGSFVVGLFGNDYVWRAAIDPIDTNLNQVDTVSSDTVGGSPWLPMATDTLVDAGVPIGFVTASKSATAISSHLPGANHQDRTTLYGSAIYRALQVQGGIKCVLWWQGESDAGNGITQALYNSRLDTLANAINADLGCKLMACKLQDLSTWGAGVDETNVNAAIVEAWGDNANVLQGPDFSDITPSVDGLHMKTDGELATAGSRWADRLLAVFYT